MLENENLAAEKAAENTENTAEKTEVLNPPSEKTYTQSEVDEIVGQRLARNSTKIRKEYEKTYGDLVDVLKAGTGEENIGKMTEAFRNYYQGKGIEIQNRSVYSDEDIEVLAKVDAEDIIRSGDDEVIEELERLNGLGVKNMTAREKALFKTLAEHQNKAEKNRALIEIGVTEDVYNSQEFKDFESKFNPNTPIVDIYNIYIKTQPKKEFKTMGSMKNDVSEDDGVKDFYSYEEAIKFTQKDFDKNPKLEEAVIASMPKWTK